MASQLCVNSWTNGVIPSSDQHPLRLMTSLQFKNFRFSKLKCLPVFPQAINKMPSNQSNDILPISLTQPMVISSESDVSNRIDELREKTRQILLSSSNLRGTLELIDTIQRLGIGYSFEKEINEILQNRAEGEPDDDLYLLALRFRLLRHNGLHANADVFEPFMDANGKFKDSLTQDIEGLLSLYEASYLGTNVEDILSQAKEFTTTHLKNSASLLTPKLCNKILSSLQLPRHLRMVRLEAKRYIEEYGKDSDHIPLLLELAKLDYNQVHLLHQMEIAEITRWWSNLGLVSKLTFGRDRPLECFLWTVGILPNPKYSAYRIHLAKTISMVLVIDDIFDTYGSYDDLVLFTKAIQRWDLKEMEQLPEYMKICYMALYNTTNEIGYEILKEHGLSVLPFLRKTWIEMVEAFMVEAEWVKGGTTPDLKNYIENGIKTAGTYMALVHLLFLIGEKVIIENMQNPLDAYPSFFYTAGTILRLWDDLGTSKEEQERGDIQSSIQLFMREKSITFEEEGRNQILQLIHRSWKDLNVELVPSNIYPLSITEVAINMSRTAQVVYQNDDDSYFSSVDDHVKNLFFTPIDI